MPRPAGRLLHVLRQVPDPRGRQGVVIRWSPCRRRSAAPSCPVLPATKRSPGGLIPRRFRCGTRWASTAARRQDQSHRAGRDDEPLPRSGGCHTSAAAVAQLVSPREPGVPGARRGVPGGRLADPDLLGGGCAQHRAELGHQPAARPAKSPTSPQHYANTPWTSPASTPDRASLNWQEP